uniref:Cadherin domain-containing protein n=1 Tax=Callorhinchus milii TaxID=7868 RepID=A0A4W3JT73_CALMI
MSPLCVIKFDIMANPRSGGLLTWKVARFVMLLCVTDLTSGQIRYSIPEELELGAFVGNVAEDLGLKIQELSRRKCRLVSDKRKQYLEVKMENGILFVNERIDREQLCGQGSACSLSFEVIVENPLEMFRVDVEILDINDNSPSFPSSVFPLQIAESMAPGARFPLESAQDPDTGTNAVSTYQISANNHFSLKVQTRSGGTKVPVLVLDKQLDREQQSVFELVLTAFDGGNPQRSGNAEITISVLDNNDNAPVFDRESYRANLLENSPVGTLVIKVNAADLDEGANGEVKYSFSKRASQHVRELFSLDVNTGEIRIQGDLDFEETNLYELDIQAMDNGAPAMAGHSSVLVALTDVNDNVPKIQLTSVSSTVREDIVPGTVIAVISVTDEDSAKNGQVNCQIPKNIPFKLQKSSENQYKLVTSGVLDREKVPVYDICISAWDSGSPPLSTNKTILVSVSDINDNAPRFDQSSYNAYVMENNAPGDSILSVTALDPDLDQNSHVSYSILENYMSSFPYVSIDSKSGNIYALRSFDYERLKNFQIQVQARDSGSPSLSSSAAVNVIILDQNDNAPAVVSPVTRNGSATVGPVPQSAPAGYLVTKVMATDTDSGQNARLSYQMLKATDPSLFSLGRNSGEIRVSRILLDKDGTKQSLLVLIRDNGQPSLSATLTVIVPIMANLTGLEFEHNHNFTDGYYSEFCWDINDNAPVFDREVYRTDLSENAPKGTLVIKVNADDSDQGTNADLTYSFSKHASRQVRELFSLDPETGEIRVQGPLDFEKSNIYELDVQAVDHGAPTMAGHSSVLVRLTDVNDNSPEIQLTSVSSTVGEEATPGTVIAVISVTDLDSGKNGEVHCQIPRNVPFQLQKSPENNYKLVTSDRLDREKVDRYNVNILAWDSGSPPLSTNKTIEVSVSDINDNAPRFDQSSYTAYVMENNAPGDSILSVTALDPDLDQNSHVSYSILENPIQDMTSFPYVSVDSKSGNIYALRSFDYERLKHFQIQVQARDSGSPSLSSSAAVNVIILDQNDNAPAVVSPVTRNGSATVGPVPQSAPAGYLVTKVMATDADSGQNARLSYQLRKATDPSLFTVGLQSGEIRLVRNILDTDAPKESLVILIKDNGQPRFSATVTIGFSIVANVTGNDFKHSNFLKNSERFSDLNLYLIIIFGTTSFLFLLIIMMLVALKCHQDRSIGRGYDSGICCYSRKESREGFARRSTARESMHYPGMRESGAIPDAYNYRFCLSPESAKSDFLFLKSYNSTLPQSTLKITDTNVVKEFDQQFNSAMKGQ